MALARAKKCVQQEERQKKAMGVDMTQAKALEDHVIVKWFYQPMESLPFEKTGMDGVDFPALLEEIDKQVNECRMQMRVVM